MDKQEQLCVFNDKENILETFFVEDYDSAIEVENVDFTKREDSGKTLFEELEDFANESIKSQIRNKTEEVRRLEEKCDKLEFSCQELQNRLNYTLDGFMIIEQDLESKIKELSEKNASERPIFRIVRKTSPENQEDGDKVCDLQELLEWKNSELIKSNSQFENMKNEATRNEDLVENLEKDLQFCRDELMVKNNELKQQTEANRKLIKAKEDIVLQMELSDLRMKELNRLLDQKVMELQNVEEQLSIKKNKTDTTETEVDEIKVLELKIIEKAQSIRVLQLITECSDFVLEKTHIKTLTLDAARHVPESVMSLILGLVRRTDDTACYYWDSTISTVASTRRVLQVKT